MHIKKTPVIAVAVAMLLPLVLAACGAKNIPVASDDGTITARVKTALMNDAQVPGAKINVQTTNGVVTMTGVVESKAQEMRAIEIARQTPGVRDVKSSLQVNSTPQS